MKLVSLIAVLLHSSFHIQCFNLDTKFPIIFSRPENSLPGRKSYFGFSLLLDEKWVLIGAPRANSSILGPKVMEPGVAYRCRLFETCEEVELERKANGPREDKSLLVNDLKNHSWIGGSMAKENRQNGKVVICGHRWKNQANLNPRSFKKKWEKYSMSGICYISQYTDNEFTQKFKYTLPEEVYEREGMNYKGVDYHGLFFQSQLGMSVYIAPPTEDSISLLIGAPGAGRYWSGGLVEYMRTIAPAVEARRRRDVRRQDFGPYLKEKFISEFDVGVEIFESFSYSGYQVAAGNFFSSQELFHVVGAPRGADMKGMVAVYKVQYSSTRNREISRNPGVIKLTGQSFGEYFGSSLAVADVTGDELDDLIVGAPLFSLNGDEGCIYVFTKYQTFDYESQYILHLKDRKVGFKVGGRFGTALASLGDIDQDRYGDIAVSAPYEEFGVIYIYNGMPNGLSLKPSQKIKASDIHKSIRGFGISISRPADIDKNKFKDIAVGSYLSEHVVLLRSYPVIELLAYLTSHEKQFNMSDTKLTVRACLLYKGSENVPNNIEVTRIIDVDIKFRRFKQVPIKHFMLSRRNQFHCENITVQINEESSDSIYNDFSDITIVLSQTLRNKANDSSHVFWVNDASSSKDADKFCSSCPVLRKIHPSEINVPYARDCGDDGVCVSDAQLLCSLYQNGTKLKINEYVIGTFSILKMTVSVSNDPHGDTLYSPKVIIDIPKEVELAQIPLTCQDTKTSVLSVVCSFSFIKPGETKSINISLDLSSHETLRVLSEKGLPLLINVNISQDNFVDKKNDNNLCNMKLNVIMNADVNITGKPDGDVFFSKNDKKATIFTHVYEVTNVGISPIRQVQALFYIPIEWHESGSSVQFSETSLEAQQNDKSIFCYIFETDVTTNPFKNELKSGVKNGKKDIMLSDNHPSNRTMYLNCSSPNIRCSAWKCNFIEFKSNTVAKITITSQLNISKLAHVMEQRDIIYFSSHGHVEMIGSNNTRYPDIKTFHDTMVSSTAIGTVTDEKIQLWIIILCIIAGILLIVAIVTGLAKAGFFKREKKEELKALKQCEQ